MDNYQRYFAAIFLVSASSTGTIAGELKFPHRFESNTRALASQVNENFDAAKLAVNDNNSRVDLLEKTKNVIQGTLSKKIAGTITIGAGAVRVVGNGTLFTQELAPGDAFLVKGGNTNAPEKLFEVGNVNSDLELILTEAHDTGVLNAEGYTDANLLEVRSGSGHPKVLISKSGQLGVGVDSPLYSVDTADAIRVGNGHFITNHPNGALVLDAGPDTIGKGLNGIWFRSMAERGLHTKYSELMRITGDGNVGIGTVTPQSALQVNGYIQLATTGGAKPPDGDCKDKTQFGRMKVDELNLFLYICTAKGWLAK